MPISPVTRRDPTKRNHHGIKREGICRCNMRCLLIRCARCQKDDTEGVLDEINKVCAEFGIKHGIVRLSSVAQAVISGRREHRLKREEKEVTKHVALRLLTMMTDSHYCESCREKVAEKEKREALRQKFTVIIGKKD